MHQYFRSLWISDTHLGGRNLKSDQLYQFLQSTDSEYLYLVGDIFDLWKLKSRWHWPDINNKIINLILDKASSGTKVFYLPGNHDAQLRNYCGSTVSSIVICDEIVHRAADGGRYLILHGDQFDCVVQNSSWLANTGSCLYDLLLVINRWYNRIRRMRGKSYFSISAWLKHQCKLAVNYIGDFEHVLSNVIEKKQVDGIICGHIHHASIRTIGQNLYGNAGDWVENCTALAENHNGTIGIIQWAEQGFVIETKKERANEKDRLGNRCLAPTN